MSLAGKKRKRSITCHDNDEEPSTKRQRLDADPKNNEENKSNKNNSQSSNISQEILTHTQSQSEDTNMEPYSQLPNTMQSNQPSIKTTPIKDEFNDESDNIEYISDGVWCVLIAVNEEFKSIQIKKPKITIGRNTLNDLILEPDASNNQSAISNFHAIIRQNNTLEDVSRNGTYITHPYSNRKIVKRSVVALKHGSLLSFGKPTQISSYYFFNMQRYMVIQSNNNLNDSNDTNSKFDVVLFKNNDIFTLKINGKICGEYSQLKYKEENITDIINNCLNDRDVSTIIYQYYGNIFESIAYDINKLRAPFKPNLKRRKSSITL